MDCVKPGRGARLDWHSPGGLLFTLDVPLHPSHVGAALSKRRVKQMDEQQGK